MIKAVREYFAGALSEFRKVTWPTREKFIRSFITVVIAVVVAVVAVTLVDALLQAGLKAILT